MRDSYSLLKRCFLEKHRLHQVCLLLLKSFQLGFDTMTFPNHIYFKTVFLFQICFFSSTIPKFVDETILSKSLLCCIGGLLSRSGVGLLSSLAKLGVFDILRSGLSLVVDRFIGGGYCIGRRLKAAGCLGWSDLE